MTNFSERLQRAARHAGIGETQSEIASDLGLSRQTVNHWFRKGAPESENLALIEKRWGVNSEWLRSGEGDMLPRLERGAEPLPDDERELLRDYRKASAQTRQNIRTVVRAMRKAVVTIAALIPPLMAPADTDAAILHKISCNDGVIHIACNWIMAWLRSHAFARGAAPA